MQSRQRLKRQEKRECRRHPEIKVITPLVIGDIVQADISRVGALRRVIGISELHQRARRIVFQAQPTGQKAIHQLIIIVGIFFA